MKESLKGPKGRREDVADDCGFQEEKVGIYLATLEDATSGKEMKF